MEASVGSVNRKTQMIDGVALFEIQSQSTRSGEGQIMFAK